MDGISCTLSQNLWSMRLILLLLTSLARLKALEKRGDFYGPY